jgi:tripartite-type tricarboxylate transporter receptor subunit TctC
MVAWVGAFVPSKTPADIVARLNEELNKILAREDTLRYFDTIGAQVYSTTPDALRNYVVEDSRRWAEMVDVAKIEKRTSQ